MLREMKGIDDDIFLSSLEDVINILLDEEKLKVKNDSWLYYTREKILNFLRDFLIEVLRENWSEHSKGNFEKVKFGF